MPLPRHLTEAPAAAVGESTAEPARRIERAAADLRAAVDALTAVPAAGLPLADQARAILTDAVRLFAHYRGLGRQPDPHSLGLNPTEAVVAAAALLRSQDLSPFEFAIWFDADTAASTGGS